MKVSPDCAKQPGGARRNKLKAQITPVIKNNGGQEAPVITRRPSIPLSFRPTSIAAYNTLRSMKSMLITGNNEFMISKPIAVATVLYDYTARTDAQININAGGSVNILEYDDGSGWIRN